MQVSRSGYGMVMVLLCATLILHPTDSHAQAPSRPLGSWSLINARLKLNQTWGVWFEGQLRSTAFFNDFFYFETKGGVTYALNDNIAMTLGLGRYETYTIGDNFERPLVQGETRSWFQLVMENQLGRVNFDHRYRVEQRYTTNGYRNRFRYRLNLVVPVNHADMRPTTLYTYVGDEVFFTNKAPYYERNRLYGGLGYVLGHDVAVQAGYLRQYDYKIETQVSRDFFQLALLFNLHLKERKGHVVPKTVD